MKIYVASSWKNSRQPLVVALLREWGYEVYDFRQPGPGHAGFNWYCVGPEHLEPEDWDAEMYTRILDLPEVEREFALDLDAMEAADLCVLVPPCGDSANREAGYMAGKGKPVVVLLEEGPQNPEIMDKLFYLCPSVHQLQETLKQF